MTIAAFCREFEKPAKQAASVSRRAPTLAPIEVALDDAKRRAASGEWEGCKGSSFVGLYAMCHRMIYGVIPDELYAIGNFRIACKSAAKMLHDSFDDDVSTMAEFVRWSWMREKRKHDWALAKGFDRNRLSWKWQFSLGLLTDFRIARNQKR